MLCRPHTAYNAKVIKLGGWCFDLDIISPAAVSIILWDMHSSSSAAGISFKNNTSPYTPNVMVQLGWEI